MSLSRTQIVNWLTRCGDIFSTESEYLTGLDREIGDADHGLNMNRGFSKVVEKLPAIADKDIGFILKNTGMTLLSSVGGASGPLFGTFFIRAATDNPGTAKPDAGRALSDVPRWRGRRNQSRESRTWR